eukprot:TRINITY_DN2259_c0_g5_i1.p1 TRINITY_DN2259_c0_g5~~TRINITY_DN2259_c0_g5_i1.p1  ORF type:complete len:297 (-),score=52.78 TRINITY_DN2259_c0_g5_i1:277-1089(-)
MGNDVVTPQAVVSLLHSGNYTPINFLSTETRVVVVALKPSTHQEVVLRLTPGIDGLPQHEIHCLTECSSHPNIVHLLDSFLFKDMCCFVFDMIHGDFLNSFLEREKSISEFECQNLARQLVSAIAFLHSARWAHGDIKPDNLFFHRETQTLKLIGFGSCFKVNVLVRHHSFKGTYLYSSPEIRQGHYQGPECDVWSLGVTLYQLMIGFLPFTETELKEGNEEFVVPGGLSPECGRVLEKCLEKKGRKRATSKELCRMPWFGGHLSSNPPT